MGKYWNPILSERSLLPVYGILQNQKNGLNRPLLLCPKSSVPYYHFPALRYIGSAGPDY